MLPEYITDYFSCHGISRKHYENSFAFSLDLAYIHNSPKQNAKMETPHPNCRRTVFDF